MNGGRGQLLQIHTQGVEQDPTCSASSWCRCSYTSLFSLLALSNLGWACLLELEMIPPACSTDVPSVTADSLGCPMTAQNLCSAVVPLSPTKLPTQGTILQLSSPGPALEGSSPGWIGGFYGCFTLLQPFIQHKQARARVRILPQKVKALLHIHSEIFYPNESYPKLSSGGIVHLKLCSLNFLKLSKLTKGVEMSTKN